MHSSQQVTSNPRFSFTGADLLAELNNPESQLSKDLENARQEALANKEAQKRVALQENIAKEQARKVEDLENELDAEREKLRVKNREEIDKYNAERARIAKKEAELLGVDAKQDAYHAALVVLDQNVRVLNDIEKELAIVQTDYEKKETQFTESKAEFAKAVIEEINSNDRYEITETGKVVRLDPATHSMGNNVVTWDIKQYSEEKRNELKKIDLEVSEGLKQATKPAAVVRHILDASKHYSTSEEMKGYEVEVTKARGVWATTMVAVITMRSARARENNIGRATQILALKMSTDKVTKKCAAVSVLDAEISAIFENRNKLIHRQKFVSNLVEININTAESYSPKGQEERFSKLRALVKRAHHEESPQYRSTNGNSA